MPEMTWAQMQEAAKSQGFEPHPIGTYNFEIATSEIKPGKASAQILIRMVNLDGPYANRSVLNRLAPFKNNGEVNGMFFQQMAALGFGPENPIWAQIDQIGLDQGLAYIAPQLVGKRTVAEINHRQFNGETTDNVRRMKPYGGPVVGGVPGIPTPGVPGQMPAPTGVPQAPAAVAPAPAVQPVPQPVAPQPPVVQPPSPVAPAPTQVVPQAAPVAAPPMDPNIAVAQAPVAQPVEMAPVAPAAAPPLTAVPPLPGPGPELGQPAVSQPVAVPTPPEPETGLAPPF